MSPRVQTLFRCEERTSVPDFLAAGAAHVLRASRLGWFEGVEEALRTARSGYNLPDAFFFLMLFFANDKFDAIRFFYGAAGPFAKRVGALFERRSLMSSSALSRLLRDVRMEEVERAKPWLLSRGAEVLTREDVLHRDRRGRRHHTLAFDPTMQGIRRRGLLEDDAYPSPERTAARIASPAHLGRKRGELGVRMTGLLHMGAWLWCDVALGTGKSVHNRQFDSAVEVTAARFSDPELEPPLLLADGEYGRVHCYTACRAAGCRLITRSCRYQLFECGQVQQTLRDARWEVVPDSGSGPQRWAADLGNIRFKPEKCTNLEPIVARVVVSRYPTEAPHGAGRFIGGQLFELFVAMDVSVDAYSAADVVALFHSRIGQENAYRLTRNETLMGVTRSYSPAGQLFAILVGLSWWNQQVALGQSAGTSPDDITTLTGARAAGACPPLPREFKAEDPTDSDELDDRTADTDAPPPTHPQTALRRVLNELPWPTLLRRRSGQWFWSQDRLELSDGCHVLFLAGVDCSDPRGPRLRFRGMASEKQATVSVDLKTAKKVRRAFRTDWPTRRPPSFRNRRPMNPEVAKGNQAKTKPHRTHLFSHLPPSPKQTQLAQVPSFRPTTARRYAESLLSAVSVQVEIEGWAPAPLRRSAIARRQHRRLTWRERLARYALAPAAQVRVTIAGPEDVLEWHRVP